MAKQTKRAVWILTTEYNEYDQYGEYFSHVFFEEPTVETLCDYFAKEHKMGGGDVAKFLQLLLHIKNGGGRQGVEGQWWNLLKVVEE